MSPRDLGRERSPERRRRHAFVVQIPLLLGLVVLWLALWGHIDVISVVTGIVFSVVVVETFYLPAVDLSGRLNLYWSARFLVRFVGRIVKASFGVAWFAVRPQAVPTSSIIAVRLRTRSDFILTLTAEANILVPGSVLVEVDRLRSILYLHVLSAPDDAAVEHARRSALEIEEAIALAIGNRDDVWRINRDRRARGLTPRAFGAKQREHEARREALLPVPSARRAHERKGR